MVGVSSKGNYSIAVIFELSKFYKKKLVRIDDVVESRGIPRSYLIQIFNKLKNSGLIESVRGNKGGYKLAIPPESITLLDVVEKVEGKFELFHNYEFNDAIKEVYKEIEQRIKKELQISFASLIERQDKIDNKIMYYI